MTLILILSNGGLQPGVPPIVQLPSSRASILADALVLDPLDILLDDTLLSSKVRARRAVLCILRSY